MFGFSDVVLELVFKIGSEHSCPGESIFQGFFKGSCPSLKFLWTVFTFVQIIIILPLLLYVDFGLFLVFSQNLFWNVRPMMLLLLFLHKFQQPSAFPLPHLFFFFVHFHLTHLHIQCCYYTRQPSWCFLLSTPQQFLYDLIHFLVFLILLFFIGKKTLNHNDNPVVDFWVAKPMLSQLTTKLWR